MSFFQYLLAALKGQSPRKSSGFTLIEIVLVVAILGILSAIALVEYSSGQGERQANFAIRQIQQDLQYAREYARASGQPTKVLIDMGSNQYSVRDDADVLLKDPLGGRDFLITFGGDEFSQVAITATDFSSDPLRFDSSGVPYQGSGLLTQQRTVVVLNNHIRVDVLPYTGKLKVEVY